MDWRRSCAVVAMRFRQGGEKFLTAWAFAEPTARIFPFPHAFGSRIWMSGLTGSLELGEDDQLQPWHNGQGQGLPGTGGTTC